KRTRPSTGISRKKRCSAVQSIRRSSFTLMRAGIEIVLRIDSGPIDSTRNCASKRTVSIGVTSIGAMNFCSTSFQYAAFATCGASFVENVLRIVWLSALPPIRFYPKSHSREAGVKAGRARRGPATGRGAAGASGSRGRAARGEVDANDGAREWAISPGSVLQHERDLHVHPPFGDSVSVDFDLLLLNPCALNVLDRFRRTLDAFADRVLETFRRGRGELDDFRNRHDRISGSAPRATRASPMPRRSGTRLGAAHGPITA